MHIRKGEGVTQKEHVNMFLVKSAGKKKIALEVLPWCSNCEEKEGDICCCVGSAQPTVMSTQSVRGTSGTSQSSLIDDWTLQRVHLHPVPLQKHWWQANMISTILWIRNEHRAVKWHQGLFWGRQMDHLPLLLFPAGHWSLMVLAPLSKHIAAKYPSRWTATMKKINNGNVMFRKKKKPKPNKLENCFYWLLCSSNSLEKQKGRKTEKHKATNAV